MRPPHLIPIDRVEGSDSALVYIKGYFSKSENPEHEQVWLQAVRAAGWRGSVYRLWWDASSKKGLAKRFLKRAVLGMGVLVVPGITLPYVVGAGVAGAGSGVRSHWHGAKRHAKKVGQGEADTLLASIPESRIVLLAHSLGARLAFYFLEKISSCRGRICDVILMGGAIRRDEEHDWANAAAVLTGVLRNCFNPDDPTLRKRYKRVTGFNNPCGLKPIELVPLNWKVENVLVGPFSHHSAEHYLRLLPVVAGDLLSRTSPGTTA